MGILCGTVEDNEFIGVGGGWSLARLKKLSASLFIRVELISCISGLLPTDYMEENKVLVVVVALELLAFFLCIYA